MTTLWTRIEERGVDPIDALWGEQCRPGNDIDVRVNDNPSRMSFWLWTCTEREIKKVQSRKEKLMT